MYVKKDNADCKYFKHAHTDTRTHTHKETWVLIFEINIDCEQCREVWRGLLRVINIRRNRIKYKFVYKKWNEGDVI